MNLLYYSLLHLNYYLVKYIANKYLHIYQYAYKI